MYDQEIPQSQTADNPVASRGRAAQLSRDTRKTTQAKQPAPLPTKTTATPDGHKGLGHFEESWGYCISFSEYGTVTTNSEYPGEIPYYVAFHLGLHCLSKYLFRRFRSTNCLTIFFDALCRKACVYPVHRHPLDTWVSMLTEPNQLLVNH